MLTVATVARGGFPNATAGRTGHARRACSFLLIYGSSEIRGNIRAVMPEAGDLIEVNDDRFNVKYAWFSRSDSSICGRNSDESGYCTIESDIREA